MTKVLESEASLMGQSLQRLNIICRQGRLLDAQGKFDEAELILERTLQGREKLLGENHATVLQTMEVLADVW